MNGLKFFVVILLGLYFLFIGKLLFVQHGEIVRHTLYQERMMDLAPFSSTWFNLKLAAKDPERFGFRALFLIGGNIFLLLPWGLAAPYLFPVLRQTRLLALSGFLLSLSIETVQYFFRIGIFELDDLLLNTLGAVAGFIIFTRVSKSSFFPFGWQENRLKQAKGKRIR